jgi:hypothetical protein
VVFARPKGQLAGRVTLEGFLPADRLRRTVANDHLKRLQEGYTLGAALDKTIARAKTVGKLGGGRLINEHGQSTLHAGLKDIIILVGDDSRSWGGGGSTGGFAIPARNWGGGGSDGGHLGKAIVVQIEVTGLAFTNRWKHHEEKPG